MNENYYKSETNDLLKLKILSAFDVQTEFNQSSYKSRIYAIERWKLENMIQVFDFVVIRVKNFDDPMRAKIKLLPFNEKIKKEIIKQKNNILYFVLNKQDVIQILELNFKIITICLVKEPDGKYSFLVSSNYSDPASGGVKICKTCLINR